MTDATAVPSSAFDPVKVDASTAGHRVRPLTVASVIEAWGPDQASCVSEALCGLVESFAEVPDAAATRILPLNAAPGGPQDALVSLLEDVIYALDVFSVVPVRFHLAETEVGGITGDMEVVPDTEVRLLGPIPKAVAYHELSIARVERGWWCHVLVES